MRLNDIALDEIDLIDPPSTNSLDPKPKKQSTDLRLMRDIINDHLGSLRSINRHFDQSNELNKAVDNLQREYESVFGMRLTERNKDAE